MKLVKKKLVVPSEETEYIPGTTMTVDELAEYKTKYKKIYMTNYIDKTYLWHRLNRKMFGAICEATKNIEDEPTLILAREKEFVKACTIYPDPETVKQDVEDEMIAERVGREILYKSGFSQPETKEL